MNSKRVLLLTAALIAFCDSGWAAKSYRASGLILKVDAPHQTLLVSCESIPGFMSAMVMPLPVHNSNELLGVDAGTTIDFTLVADETSSYIEKIHVRRNENVEQDPLAAGRLKLLAGIAGPQLAPELKTGDHVPDFSLIDQNRHRVALSQFAGKVVALTFVYTHCALPDYCFRMSTNFSRLQKRFAAQVERDLILLTITFDPVHDTPEVMAKYGKIWNADPKGWRLLTGPPSEVNQVCNKLGMSFWPDEGLMTHSLHTIVIDRNGDLAANLAGNKFSADQLGDLVQTVMTHP
jgi:protein SCO1/2